ncbi:MAG: hypothetical protein ACD_79C00201G0010 [uncultured bacterium]|nr:MAG: hypothetical protein ACD_79C00201G0010 [uncultured bacterium]
MSLGYQYIKKIIQLESMYNHFKNGLDRKIIKYILIFLFISQSSFAKAGNNK